MKIVQSLDYYESSLLVWQISEAVKCETKEQKEGFFSLLLGALAASLLGGTYVIWASESIIRAGKYFSCHPIVQLILKYKNIIKMNLHLMTFIQKIIYLK